jgi:glycopeptide antibiotics resistance protein
MTEQVLLGVLAVAIGVVLAVLAFVPYVAIAQRRHGRLGAPRLLVSLAMLIYGIAIWTYTLLPFPDPDAYRCAGVELDPLRIATDLSSGLGGGNALANPAVLQLFLNVVLFIPLGVFIRIVWDRGILVSIAAGLGLSLVVELTQLTGVWGVYPCAYRVFDVGDLFTNTVGAAVGSLAALALPRTRRIGRGDATDIDPPQPVTRWRRALAMMCDWVSVYLIGLTASLPVAAFIFLVAGRQALVDSEGALEIVATVAALAVTGGIALGTRRTIGDHALQLAYGGSRLPPFATAVLRFVGGIGGYQILTAFTPGANPVSGAFVAASIVLLFTTARGRGLPGLASRQVLGDARDRRESAAGVEG